MVSWRGDLSSGGGGSQCGAPRGARASGHRPGPQRRWLGEGAGVGGAGWRWRRCTAIWMHVPAELRARVLQAAVSALRPGGVLLFEGYTPRQLGRDSGGPPSVEL